jgi:hypothetical protein
MPDDNRISASLTDANKTAILQKIADLRASLPVLVNLTPAERQQLPKLGGKTLGFDEKCASYMAQNPRLVPGFVDLAELDKDRALRTPLGFALPKTTLHRRKRQRAGALQDASCDSEPHSFPPVFWAVQVSRCVACSGLLPRLDLQILAGWKSLTNSANCGACSRRSTNASACAPMA